MTGPSAQPDQLRAGEAFGPFRLLEPLGEGGMGEVWRALREPDGVEVALKVIKPGLLADEQHQRRFIREARAAREVVHRHIAEVLNVGAVEGRRFIAMRFVQGDSLAARIDVQGGLALPEVVELAAHLGAGLDALHAAGVVHRDVKPSNVLLDPARGAVLTDFGLAKHRDYSAVTAPGQVLGTLNYLAPEILRGEEPTRATDLYGLGCVVFECLAGRPPFAGRSIFEIGLAHLEEEPGDPCAGRADVPAGVGDFACTALAKDPAARPPTATAYARMLLVAARSG